MIDETQLYQSTNNGGQRPLPPKIGKPQKIAAAGLGVFAVFIMVMWLVQLKSNLSQPFAYKGDKTAGTEGVDGQTDDVALKNQDTDKDGLFDWDELNIYRTSPYLADSDSDGFPDKEEVDNNKDPNCPAGRTCGSVGIVDGDKNVVSPGEASPSTNPADNNLLNQLNTGSQPATGASTTPDASASQLKSLLGNEIDATTLRQMLLNNGMQKSDLDKISDEDLMNAYKQMLNQ